MNEPSPEPVWAGLVRLLETWRPLGQEQEVLRCQYVALLRGQGAAATDRSSGPEHITASCFLLTPDFSQVLLCFHRKGRFWVQLGGHVEHGDGSVMAAALREAREEGGITDLALTTPVLFDLDRHALGAGFMSCRVHWDVGLVAVAPAGSIPTTSQESDDVAWWPVDALPEMVPDSLPARLGALLVELHRRTDV